MDLIINFVWIGPGALPELESFIVESWIARGVTVCVFTHNPYGANAHDQNSLGVPRECNVIRLPDVIDTDHVRASPCPKTGQVLLGWFDRKMEKFAQPGKMFWKTRGMPFTFNVVDLCKSYIAATCPGIVLDMKVGPSLHILKYVKSGVFHDFFVGYVRCGTIENQCMGSMNEDDTVRHRYGAEFDRRLFQRRIVQTMVSEYTDPWYPEATIAHNGTCSNTIKDVWFDVGKYGKDQHARLGVFNADVVGIADEPEYGPFRIFKREDDQSNKHGGVSTTDEERQAAIRMARLELARAPALVHPTLTRARIPAGRRRLPTPKRFKPGT